MVAPEQDTTDYLIDLVEQYFLFPCMARTPKLMHGFCMFLPMFLVAFSFMLMVVVLSWREKKTKAAAAAAETTTAEAKTTTAEAKKTK